MIEGSTTEGKGPGCPGGRPIRLNSAGRNVLVASIAPIMVTSITPLFP